MTEKQAFEARQLINSAAKSLWQVKQLCGDSKADQALDAALQSQIDGLAAIVQFKIKEEIQKPKS